MRDRLIELIKQGDKTFADKYTGKVMSHIDEVHEFVADYLLANGVIVPPCKVGDTIWNIEYKQLGECEVVEIGENRHYPYIKVEPKAFRGIQKGYTFYQIGKTVFLTKEEAEQALKGGEG